MRKKERKIANTPSGSRCVIAAYLVSPVPSPLPFSAPCPVSSLLMPWISFGKQRSSRLFRFYLSKPPERPSSYSRLSSSKTVSPRRFLSLSPPLTVGEKFRKRVNIKGSNSPPPPSFRRAHTDNGGPAFGERRDTIFISRDRKILQSAGRDFYRRDGPSLLSLSSRLHHCSYLYAGWKRKFFELLFAIESIDRERRSHTWKIDLEMQILQCMCDIGRIIVAYIQYSVFTLLERELLSANVIRTIAILAYPNEVRTTLRRWYGQGSRRIPLCYRARPLARVRENYLWHKDDRWWAARKQVSRLLISRSGSLIIVTA